VRFSFVLFGHPPEHCSPVAERAEALGFDAVWFGDHVLTPERHESAYPYRPSAGYAPTTPLGDVWSLIAHASATTSRITLGPNVYVLPLRHPALAAQAALTVQNLSGGRLVFGVGTGWLREEFEQLGLPFAGRGRRLDEALEAVQLLWSGDPVSFVGQSFRLHEVRLGGTLCAPIPIAVGGASDAALRRAARFGTWHGPELMLADNVRCRETLQRFRRELDLDDAALRLYVKPLEPVDRDLVRRYSDAGFDDLVVAFGHLDEHGKPRSLDGSLARLEALAEAVS
jgi:probable F420-dependent oxidoreductase